MSLCFPTGGWEQALPLVETTLAGSCHLDPFSTWLTTMNPKIDWRGNWQKGLDLVCTSIVSCRYALQTNLMRARILRVTY